MTRPHNTSISRFKCGCKLPCETSGVGDGYASPGPVMVYKMDRQEIERLYGPPTDPEKAKQVRQWYRTILGKREKHEEEVCEEMEALHQEGVTAETGAALSTAEAEATWEAEKRPEPESCNQQPENKRDRTWERSERLKNARQKLSRDTYLHLKEQGWGDRKICDVYSIHPTVLVALKEEWGLKGFTLLSTKRGEAATQEQDAEQQVNQASIQPAGDLHEYFSGLVCFLPEPLEDVFKVSEQVLSLTRMCHELERKVEQITAGVKYQIDQITGVLNALKENLEDLEHDYRHHRHQVGPGHWSGKAEV